MLWMKVNVHVYVCVYVCVYSLKCVNFLFENGRLLITLLRLRWSFVRLYTCKFGYCITWRRKELDLRKDLTVQKELNRLLFMFI